VPLFSSRMKPKPLVWLKNFTIPSFMINKNLRPQDIGFCGFLIEF
jgi:hypothetical protein